MRRGSMIAVVALLCVGTVACSYRTREIVPTIAPNAQSSRVYAADGTLITTLHGEENREELPLTAIPKQLQDAVIAIEDQRFWQHKGVDIRAILRAMREDALAGGAAQGGSTITQQYIKTTMLGTDKTLKRKLQEAALAYQFERKYTKERILELYLNTIYFGNGAYGVQAAAREYFGKPVADLSLAQSALLAGLIRRPSSYDPYDFPDNAISRRNIVLSKMAELGLTSPAKVAAAKAEPLTLAEPTPVAERYQAAHFVEEVKQFVLDDPRFGDTPAERRSLLFSGGLRIYTTIDLAAQQAAEAAVNAILPNPNGPEVALVAVEPATGHVKAMVGGRDFFGGGATAKFNLAMGKGRPTGSAFKPFVLTTALEQNLPLTTTYPAPGTINLPLPNGQVWSPGNYDSGESVAASDLVEGTVHSYNTLFAQLILTVGPDNAIDTAKRLGVRPPNGLQANPAAVLGTNDVRVLDMATAYGTFANHGLYVAPIMVTKILRANGTVLYQARHVQEKAIEAPIADTVTAVLRQVIERGTGTRANIGRPAAGKTGTSQEWRNAWFAGYTPQLSTAVWVGYSQGEVSMVPPTTGIRITGGSYPAQIWQNFVSTALANVPVVDFTAPPAPVTTTTTLAASATTVAAAPSTTARPLAMSSGASVPAVVGLSRTAAVAAIERAGLEAQVKMVGSSDEPGSVLDQSPVAGSSVDIGSTVVIAVAEPPPVEMVRVPNVLNLRSDAAVAALEKSGFKVTVIRQRGPASAGRVWKQSPAADENAPKGATVTIWVATRN